jgi:hypothetical protein
MAPAEKDTKDAKDVKDEKDAKDVKDAKALIIKAKGEGKLRQQVKLYFITFQDLFCCVYVCRA